jgi:hypothetical protein
MSAELTFRYAPKDSLIETSSWTLVLAIDENDKSVVASILWGDNDRPTGAWSVPLTDIRRLMAFAQPNEKLEN